MTEIKNKATQYDKFRTVEIGEMGKVVTGTTPPTKNEELFGQEYPFITPGDIENGYRYVNADRFLSEEGKKSQSNKLLPKDSVCFTCIGATIGKICMTDEPSFTNQQINSVIVDKEKFDPNYIFYLLKEHSERIEKRASGAATPIVNKTSFSGIKFKVPPLSKQKEVGSVLSIFDDLIENNKRRIKILEDLAETIYREWFINFNFPGSEEIGMKDSELGLIPETFEVCEFQEELEIQNGFAFKSETYSENGMPIIRTKDFSSTKFIDREEDVKVPYELAKEKRKYRLKELDFLLIMVGASIGNYGIVMEKDLPALQNQNMWAVRPKEDSYFSKNFVIYHMPSLVKRQKNFARGAAREYFRKGDFTSAKITKPPKPLVKLFDKEVGKTIKLINTLLQSNEILGQIRDLLLPRLISGEVKPE